jgi:hypothetical protein
MDPAWLGAIAGMIVAVPVLGDDHEAAVDGWLAVEAPAAQEAGLDADGGPAVPPHRSHLPPG